MWQPGNLVARKALAESVWILLPYFLEIKQLNVFLQNLPIFFIYFFIISQEKIKFKIDAFRALLSLSNM